jgi:ubiquinone/menaquinone biosynthesis C-methylase UbiE
MDQFGRVERDARGEQIEWLAACLDAQPALPQARQIAAQSLALLHLAPGQSVLEVGCGTGVFLPFLAAAVGPRGRVVGIDHAPEFVVAFRRRAEFFVEREWSSYVA